MTPKQLELLKFIEKFIDDNGYSPSFVDMMQATGQKSKSSIHRLLTGLEERGRIRRISKRSRAIELVRDPEIPVALSHLSLGQLANEARKRNLSLCHTWRDDHGDRVFVPVRAEPSLSA